MYIIYIRVKSYVFNFLDVQDAAEGLINFIKNTNPANWNNTYNLGQVSKVRENTLFIANCIKKICKEKGLEVLWDESTVNIRISSKDEYFDFEDTLNETEDASDGTITERVKRFIEEF